MTEQEFNEMQRQFFEKEMRLLNLVVDTLLKDEQRRLETTKVIITAMTAAGVVTAALAGLLALVLRSH